MSTEMAIQVSPEAESEDQMIANLRTVFEKACNSIVDATRLAREVGELRQSVSELKAELDRIIGRNKELDEQLLTIRRSRDAALNDLAFARRERDEAEAENAQLQRRIEELLLSREQDRSAFLAEIGQARESLKVAGTSIDFANEVKAKLGEDNAKLRDQLAAARRENEHISSQASAMGQEVASLRDANHRLGDERNEAEMAQLQSEENATKLQAKLDQIMALVCPKPVVNQSI